MTHFPLQNDYFHRLKTLKWKMLFNTADIFWYGHFFYFFFKSILIFLLNKACILMYYIHINQQGLSQKLCQRVMAKHNGVLQ